MKSALQGHRDLECWQVAMEVVMDIYTATQRFPKDEMYGLTSQLRRAAVSIPSNIAEGYGRKSRRELRKFIGNAIGSLLELETQVEIARDLGYFAPHVATDYRKPCGSRSFSTAFDPGPKNRSKRKTRPDLRITNFEF